MQPLTRIRIILFAFMVFGSFANFAQNDWGMNVIIACQLLMALSFLWQAISIYYKRIKNNQLKGFNIIQVSFIGIYFISLIINDFQIILIACLINFILFIIDSIVAYRKIKRSETYFTGVFENFTLFLGLQAIAYKNLSFNGSGILIISSTYLFFVPYYFAKTITMIKQNKSNKSVAFILAILHFCLASYAVAGAFKIMHWPGANMLLNFTSPLFIIIILIGFLFQQLKYYGDTKTFINVLKIPTTHVVFIFMIFFIRNTHRYLVTNKNAPNYYESHIPQPILNMVNNGTRVDEEIAAIAKSQYFTFIEHCKENEFIK